MKRLNRFKKESETMDLILENETQQEINELFRSFTNQIDNTKHVLEERNTNLMTRFENVEKIISIAYGVR